MNAVVQAALDRKWSRIRSLRHKLPRGQRSEGREVRAYGDAAQSSGIDSLHKSLQQVNGWMMIGFEGSGI